MIRTHYLVIVLTAVGALVGGYLLLPRREEQITMLARDGLYGTALREASSMTAEANRRPSILMQLFTLREKQGEHANALEALKAYLKIRPDDAAAREKLVDLLSRGDDVNAWLAALAELAVMYPNAARIDLLLGMYRLHGRHDDELRYLQTFAGSRFFGAGHYERLGTLLAEGGDLRAAERWLLVADRLALPSESNGRLILLSVLLDNNEFDEAYERATAWMRIWRNPYLVGKMLLRIAQSGHPRSRELAAAAVALMPEATFDITSVLTRRGQAAVSRAMLARWTDYVRHPSAEQVRGYVYAARQSGEESGPFMLLARLVRSGVQPETQAMLVQEISYAYGTAALAPLHSQLGEQVWRSRPLFAAELALTENDLPTARAFLAKVEPAGLAPAQRDLWLSLLERSQDETGAFRVLADLWNKQRLPKELYGALARSALKLGNSQLHDAILASLKK